MSVISAKGTRGRRGLFAAAAALLLSGCASGELSPLGSSLQGVVPGLSSGPAPAERAAELPYASLLLDTRERSGLIVLGAESGRHTLWPTGQQGAISLYQDGLNATAGFSDDLLSLSYHSYSTQPASGPAQAAHGDNPRAADAATLTPWQQDTPVHYAIESYSQGANGDVRLNRGKAQLRCAAAEPYPLPLGERRLEHCTEQVRWETGEQSVSHFYRSPETRRLWAAEVTPWPGAARIRWEVARAWW
ncbi:hypothetical protein [Halomonas sp. Y3]|uniref:hypothetical protein n=1 Tax=Halomonas sp. Y3 TaxID=2956797 RepID=UPI0020A119EA|nr:hypothetical protein [Halomonas sp. Y3]